MVEIPSEIGSFGFGFRVLKNLDGSLTYHTKTLNQNVHIEIVIMQLKVFIRNLEEEYYLKFGKK